jgi:hypothetical protein
MVGDAPQRVSDDALEEDIRLASHASVFAYQFEGKSYVVLRLEDVATYVLDLANGDMPSRFSTQGRGNWAPLCAMTIAGVPYFGDDSSSSVWTFSEGAVTDSGQPEMPRYFSAGLPSSTNLSVFNLVVDGNNGSATVETGRAPSRSWRCAIPAMAGATSATGAERHGDAWANPSGAPGSVRAARSHTGLSSPSSGCWPVRRFASSGLGSMKTSLVVQ